jgi:molybdate transport system substrate-binding protein
MPAYERTSGNKVSFAIFTPLVVKERLLKGEAADVAFVGSNQLAELENAGKVVPGSRTRLGTTFLAVAVRPGAPHPDLSSPDAVKRAIRAAKGVAISDPAGGAVQGRFVLDLADRFAFDDELRSRFKMIPGAGNQVAEAVVKGEADLGITISSEIASVKGAEVAGRLPSEMQNINATVAILLTGSAEPQAGRELIQYMTSQEAQSVMRRNGIEPE